MNRALLTTELQRDEGERLVVYDDATGKPITPGTVVKGHPTIGVGRALDVRGITKAESDFLLGNDIDFFSHALMSLLPWFENFDPTRQRILVNMALNLGVDGLLKFHDTLRYCEEGRFELASRAMQDSAWYKQVGDRGERLAILMKDGGK